MANYKSKTSVNPKSKILKSKIQNPWVGKGGLPPLWDLARKTICFCP